jgi:hypothetical protein
MFKSDYISRLQKCIQNVIQQECSIIDVFLNFVFFIFWRKKNNFIEHIYLC